MAIMGALAVAGAPAASAVPTCGTPTYDRTRVVSTCLGTGQFRLGLQCEKAWPWESTWTAYGPWQNAPLTGVYVPPTCDILHYWTAIVQKR